MKRVLEVKRNSQNPRWYEKNLNPWGFHVNDCVLRAYCIGLLMKYEFLFAYAKDQKSASVWSLSKTCNFINGMNDRELADALPPGFIGEPCAEIPDFGPFSKMTLNQFIDKMQELGKSGIYLVDVGEDHAQHIVCAYIKKTRSYFIDSFDSGDLSVFEFRKVMRQVPVGDPRRLDLRVILKPDSWKNRFRDAFFEKAEEWTNEKDLNRKAEITDEILFMSSGELYDLDEPQNINMRDVLGKDAFDKADEIRKTAGV